ncbi:MAG: TPM domain-containing protein [Bacteroidales bacterium]|nr:TPM domain-containing protein [Bacteroidales bacterium]
MIKKILNDEAQKAIEAKITDIESKSSAEVRVLFLTKEKHSEKKLSIEELALRKFAELAMHETENKTGILLMIHLKRRQFHIMGDEGINLHIPDKNWQPYAEKLSEYFAKNEFEIGIVSILDEIGLILAKHFPVSEDDVNELSNEIVVD